MASAARDIAEAAEAAQAASDALHEAQLRLLDELMAYRPDTSAFAEPFSDDAVIFTHTFARYLNGACSLQVAQEAWDTYSAEVKTRLVKPLERRHIPVPPEILATYACSLTDETASLDDFSRRVLDLCLLASYLEMLFFRNIELQGPVAAVYAHLLATGMDEDTALGMLLHDRSAYSVKFFRYPEGESSTQAATLNALGRFVLTLVPERLDLLIRLASPVSKRRSPHGRPSLSQLVTLLGTFPDTLPLAWQVARQAPPLIAGECARVLLEKDPAGFDADLQAQLDLTLWMRDERLAACHALLDAECEAMDDLLLMRSWLSVSNGDNPMDEAIPVWLAKSTPLIWWTPFLSAMADAQVLEQFGQGVKGVRDPLSGKTASLGIWRQIRRGAQQSHVRMKVGSSVRSFTRDNFFSAYRLLIPQAFTQAGAHLGLSGDELREALTPRLGFDAQGRRTLDYGGAAGRQFALRLGTDGALRTADATGKELRALPAPTARDDPQQVAEARETFRALKRQIPQALITAAQILREAQAVQRSWPLARWQSLYVRHPLLRLLATRVIWQTSDRSGSHTYTFRPMEDGTLTTANDESVDLPENATITLVRTDTLDRPTSEAWRRHLRDYEVAPLLDQLPPT